MNYEGKVRETREESDGKMRLVFLPDKMETHFHLIHELGHPR